MGGCSVLSVDVLALKSFISACDGEHSDADRHWNYEITFFTPLCFCKLVNFSPHHVQLKSLFRKALWK